MNVSKIIGGLLAVYSLNSMAAIEKIEYQDVYGTPKSFSPSASAQHINPNSNMTMSVSAGLNRKIQVELRDSLGQVVTTQTSSIIGVLDRISGSAGDFYGKVMSLATPVDGTYTVSAKILDINNNIVQEDNYSIVIDTTPPSGSPTWGVKKYGYPTGILGHLSPYGRFRELTMEGVSDTSGLSNAVFVAGSVGGVLKTSSVTSTININSDLGSVTLLDYIPNDPSLFPLPQGTYDIGFRVFDKAGNFSDFTHVSKVEMKNDYMMPIREIWNPLANKWETYVDGMTIYENPYKIRYKFLKTEMAKNHPEGFGWDLTPQYEDATYSYIEKKWVVPAARTYHPFWTISGSERSNLAGYLQNLVLASGVEQAPKGLAVNYKSNVNPVDWRLDGQVDTSLPASKGTTISITDILYKVEARSYKQLAYVDGGSRPEFGVNNRCVVEPGQSSCIANGVNYTMPSVDNGYEAYSVFVCQTTDGTTCTNTFAPSHFTYFLVRWDKNPLTITDTVLNNGVVTYKLNNGDYIGNWTDYMFAIKNTDVCAINLTSGNEQVISPSTSVKLDTQNFQYSFDLSTLSEGRYKLEACAMDIHYNETRVLIADNFLKDATAPLVYLHDKGVKVNDGDTVRGLEGLEITIDDLSSYTINKVALTGGPINESLILALRELGGDKYSLEYPKLFPSLEAGQEYTLSVDVIDQQGNQRIASFVMNYLPPNLVNLPAIESLPVNQNLLDANDEPIAKITASDLTIEDGTPIEGAQNLVFTLRSDAKFSVVVSGITVNPGETKTVTVNAKSGTINVPIFPAVSGITGKANFIAEIPVLSVPPYCNTGFEHVNSQCEKLLTSTLALSCEVNYNLDPALGTCTLVETTPKPKVCPSGYSIKGSSCEKITTTTPTQGCATGWTQVGSQCERFVAQSYTSKYCPSGYVVIENDNYNQRPGSTVKGSNLIESYGSLTMGTQRCVKKIGNAQCDSGMNYQSDIDECVTNKVLKNADGTCPSGYPYTFASQPSYCFARGDTLSSAVFPYMFCPSGTSVYNGYYCADQAQVSTNYQYVCGSGTLTYNASTNRCEGTYTAPLTQTCSSGSLVGGQCIVTETTSLIDGVCPTGFNDVGGGICEKITTKDAINNCPVGYTPNIPMNRCEKLIIEPTLW